MEETEFLYAYLTASGFGGKQGRQYLQYFGSAKAIFQATEKELSEIMTPAQVKRLLQVKETGDPAAKFNELRQKGIAFIPCGDALYPKRLTDIPDAPSALYVKGALPDDALPSVAVVGARKCSDYGRYAAREFGYRLAQAGVQVVSGLAMGIDSISQAGCLEAGGKTFGVLGCGVDICYPPSNEALYSELCKTGGVLSEYPPGTAPKPQLFPPRNRIISGLCDILLVIEAKEKSGTFITVDMALEQGREIYALAGRICDPLSQGCHGLIRQGAGIALGPEEVIDALIQMGKLQPRSINSADEDTTLSVPEGLSPIEGEVLKTLRKTTLYPEEILHRLRSDKLYNADPYVLEKSPYTYNRAEDITMSDILCALVELCLRGLACQDASGGFRLP